MTITKDQLTVTDAAKALAALQAEQNAVGDTITAARRAGDSGAVIAAEQRREDLPAEINNARVDVLRAQLEERWPEAERAVAAERQANTFAHEASEALTRFRKDLELPNTAAGVAEWKIRHAQILQEVHETGEAWKGARYAALLALAQVDELEEAITEATGEPPATGDGLRAPVGRLAANFALRNPRLGTDEYQSGYIRPTSFTAGCTPPRWAAFLLADNPYAWEVSA